MANNISIVTKDACCGCTACIGSCTFSAITMKPDHEGFLYPQVNDSLCTDCGACLKVCKTEVFYTAPQKVFVCLSKDDELRARSSSGGVFSALAEMVLDRGGYVAGVGYNKSFDEAVHKIISDQSELDDLRRSKFIQSTKYDVFRQIKVLLKENKEVLFVGTPCEVGGLRQFLRKNYDNLLTCDLICGCTSSPKVYKLYIDFLKDKYQANVTGVNFKDKRNGWRGKGIAVTFDTGEEYYNSILDDNYTVSFHSRFNIRPSCFSCKYRNLQRTSDITLGDFWAIEKYNDVYDDNKGTSFIMTNTVKGELYVQKMQNMVADQIAIDIENYSSNYNWCMHKNPGAPDGNARMAFYDDLDRMPFDELAEKHLAKIKEERKNRKLNIK